MKADGGIRRLFQGRRWCWWNCKPLLLLIIIFCAFATFPVWVWLFGGTWLWLLGVLIS